MSFHEIMPFNTPPVPTTTCQSSDGQVPRGLEWNVYTRPSGSACASAAPQIAVTASELTANSFHHRCLPL